MPNSPSAAVRSLPALVRGQHNVEPYSDRASSPSAAAPAPFESLEPRQLMSVSHDADGFSVVTPPSGAKVVYVSSSQGSDNNSGTSTSSPVRSIARGKALLRNGTGDQLLLRRGDVWRENFGHWKLSGRSSSDPLVIGAYGSGNRPRLETGGNPGFTAFSASVHDVMIQGVHLTATGRGSRMPDGINVIGRMTGLTIEDVKVEGYRNNISLEDGMGAVRNVTIRRSVILDSYSTGSHSQGLYADGVQGLRLEDNIFDGNGWRGRSGATMFNHNAYVTARSSGLVAVNNVFANGSGHGLQARPGGTVDSNLFINNAVGLSFGLVNGGGSVKAGGVTGSVNNNVFTGGHSASGLPAGVGLEVSNVKSATIAGNLFTNGQMSSRNPAINLTTLNGTSNGNQAVGIQNLSITDNTVYKWGGGIQIAGGLKTNASGPTGLRNLTVRNNDFQEIANYQAVAHGPSWGSESWSGNRYDTTSSFHTKSMATVGGRGMDIGGFKRYESGAQLTQVNYPDEGRSVNGYAGDYLARARGLSSENWNSRYLARSVIGYLKGGFRGGSSTTAPVPVDSRPSTPAPSKSGSSSSSGPSVSVGDFKATEPDAGTTTFRFTVKLSAKSSKTVHVDWETKQSSAHSGRDYVGRNGSFAFAPGETVKTLTVQVKGDRTREGTESFNLNLLRVSGGKIGDGQGIGTIVNDD